ncbi:MAG: AAA family ATPase [Deltaproteobacteria bacterium]|nr:AAA family ATPase [Deltaproteobacteria bacterium]
MVETNSDPAVRALQATGQKGQAPDPDPSSAGEPQTAGRPKTDGPSQTTTAGRPKTDGPSQTTTAGRPKIDQSNHTPSIADAIRVVAALRQGVTRAFLGKSDVLDLALSCLLARGHLLIEDVPGVGKTTLAQALARSMGGTFRRIQFTADLMPSDVLGVSVYDQQSDFVFRPGPIFANVVLADEVNRASPRTQSALLEAMNEGQVTVDNDTMRLEHPFFVVATQNPVEHFGTYPLPDSQMDRFTIRTKIGYPTHEQEQQILTSHQDRNPSARLTAVTDPLQVAMAQDAVVTIHADESLQQYVLAIVDATRRSNRVAVGVSTRGAKAWYQVAKAHALVVGRDFCTPDDFKQTAMAALAHRLVVATTYETLSETRKEAQTILADILEDVPVPV